MKKKVIRGKAKKKTYKKVAKKPSKKNGTSTTNNLTFGQKSADLVTTILGSWGFIIFFIVFMIIWIYLNVRALLGVWDPYPYILLNFVLSCLAAIQAPIILMSQNRQAERDRVSFKYDYQINRKSEREIQKIMRELRTIKRYVYEHLRDNKK